MAKPTRSAHLRSTAHGLSQHAPTFDDRGRNDESNVVPPSKLDGRISRIQLSSQWVPLGIGPASTGGHQTE